MGKFEDKTGMKFGKLTVLKYLGHSKWECKCDCGNITKIATSDLNNGHSKSCGCLRKRWNIDETFFETIDSEEKAYVLGFIAADGNLSNQSNNVKIEIKYTDVEILEKIKKAMAYNFEIIHYNYKSYFDGYDKIYDNHLVRLNITNKKIYNDLLKYGLTPNKSKTLDIDISKIPQTLFRHFLRGMWDGDGSISISTKNRKSPQPTLNLTTSEKMCEKIIYYLKENIIDFNEHIYLRNKNKKDTKTLVISGRDNISQCLELLYRDATIYMDRKYQKNLEIKKIYETKLINSND